MGDTAGTRGRACFSAAGRLPCAPPASAPRPLLPPPPLPPPLPLPRVARAAAATRGRARANRLCASAARATSSPCGEPGAKRGGERAWECREGVGVPGDGCVLLAGGGSGSDASPEGEHQGGITRGVTRGRSQGPRGLQLQLLAQRTLSMQPSGDRPADWISSCDTRIGARVRRRACGRGKRERGALSPLMESEERSAVPADDSLLGASFDRCASLLGRGVAAAVPAYSVRGRRGPAAASDASLPEGSRLDASADPAEGVVLVLARRRRPLRRRFAVRWPSRRLVVGVDVREADLARLARRRRPRRSRRRSSSRRGGRCRCRCCWRRHCPLCLLGPPHDAAPLAEAPPVEGVRTRS